MSRSSLLEAVASMREGSSRGTNERLIKRSQASHEVFKFRGSVFYTWLYYRRTTLEALVTNYGIVRKPHRAGMAILSRNVVFTVDNIEVWPLDLAWVGRCE